MTFFEIYIQALVLILSVMTLLWVVSLIIRNVSIVDIFWGLGFVVCGIFYFFTTHGNPERKAIILILVILWGFRLALYLLWRNAGKGEDFRYREFRKKYGEKRYWWISFFQTFMLQGILMWLISAPLLGAQYYSANMSVSDYAGCAFWIVGLIFEAGGDFQLTKFRSDPANKGKLLTTGFWKMTRHPNYFGDSAIWWGYGLICLGAGSYLPIAGSILMTTLIIKVSGVALLEKSLKEKKPGYREYADATSAFFPWFPKKMKSLT